MPSWNNIFSQACERWSSAPKGRMSCTGTKKVSDAWQLSRRGKVQISKPPGEKKTFTTKKWNMIHNKNWGLRAGKAAASDFRNFHPRSTLYSLHSGLYTSHCPLYILHSALYTSHFPPRTFYFALRTSQSPLHTLHATFPTQHCTFFTPRTFCYGDRGNIYKTVPITIFAKVFYVTAFGFVGCIIFP